MITFNTGSGSSRPSAGFTLIEIMVVVAILSILLTVALPAYENSLQKGRRADGKAALMDAANRQEQFMLDRGTYTLNMTELGFGADPLVSDEEHYTVDAVACAGGTIANCYTLTATPRAGSPQTEDSACVTFVLGSNGAQTATGSDNQNCW